MSIVGTDLDMIRFHLMRAVEGLEQRLRDIESRLRALEQLSVCATDPEE